MEFRKLLPERSLIAIASSRALLDDIVFWPLTGLHAMAALNVQKSVLTEVVFVVCIRVSGFVALA